MKAETDIGDPVDVPESLVRKWKLKSKDFKNDANSDLIYKVIEMLGEVEGKVVPYVEGRFLIDYTLSTLPDGGGYPKESSLRVGDVEVVAFGWTSELDEKYAPIHMLGLRKGGPKRE